MLLRDQRFLHAFANTALYWLVDVVFILSLALFMAVLLQSNGLRGRRVYRLILFLPNVTATVAVGLVFNMVFDYNSGLVNSILQALGMHRLPWLNSTGLSKIPVMVLNVWRVTPWYMLILLSGLQAINPELYQAATVDGAGPGPEAVLHHHPEPRHGALFLLPHGDHRLVPHLHGAVHHDERRAGVLVPFHRAVSLRERLHRVQAGIRVRHRLRADPHPPGDIRHAGDLHAQAGARSSEGRAMRRDGHGRGHPPFTSFSSSGAPCRCFPLLWMVGHVDQAGLGGDRRVWPR